MKNKIYFIFLILSIYFFHSCTSVNYVNKKKLVKIFSKDAVNWNIDECNKMLDFYAADNITHQFLNSSPINQNVLIKILLLNKATIKAMSRKEVIERRLKSEEYYSILDSYLTAFTSLKYDKTRNEIIESDPNYTKGYCFKVYIENISDPFQPIFLEDGYSYFFLENKEGDYSRVTEVSGLYAEDFIQLDGYLNVVITFSPFAVGGKRLFSSKNLNESYKLVFNGLQETSIEIEWNID